MKNSISRTTMPMDTSGKVSIMNPTNVNNNSKNNNVQPETPEIGVEATTLPPINKKNQVTEAADDMINKLQSYISSEIECK